MSNITLTKATKPKRIQVAFTSSPAFQSRLTSLSNKYYGMTIPEIVKMAIIKLDNSQDDDETDFIRKDKVLYETLLRHKAYDSAATADKNFASINDFNNATDNF